MTRYCATLIKRQVSTGAEAGAAVNSVIQLRTKASAYSAKKHLHVHRLQLEPDLKEPVWPVEVHQDAHMEALI